MVRPGTGIWNATSTGALGTICARSATSGPWGSVSESEHRDARKEAGMPDYGIDELIITCMARELRGEVIVSSVTSLGALAAHLAKSTHAPELAVLSTPESGMDVVPLPTLSLGQFLTDNQRAIPLSMEDIFDAIFTDRFRIWINPA